METKLLKANELMYKIASRRLTLNRKGKNRIKRYQEDLTKLCAQKACSIAIKQLALQFDDEQVCQVLDDIYTRKDTGYYDGNPLKLGQLGRNLIQLMKQGANAVELVGYLEFG